MTTAVPPKTPRLPLIVGMAAYAFQGMGVSLLGVAWPAIRDGFSLPLDAVGWLLLTGTVGHLVTSTNNGRLLARVSLGTALIIGTLVTAAGIGLTALAPVWWLLIVFSFISGAGTGFVSPALNTRIAATRSPNLMNWLHASFGVGATVGPAIMTALITSGQSWRLGYGLAAGLHLLAMAGFWLTRSFWATTPQTRQRERETAVAFRDTFARPLTWLSIFVFFMYTGMESTTGQWSFVLFTESRGITAAAAGLWVSIFWACMTIGRLLIGTLVDRIGLNRVLRVSLLTVVLGTVLLWQNVGGNSLFTLAIIGSGLSAVFPLLMTATPNRLGSAHAANAIGFQTAAAGMGASVLPALAGTIADTWGLEVIGPFLVVTAVTLFLGHEAILLRERQSQPQPTSLES